ncbi:MAG: hypothetical protein ACR2KK_18980 [Acidimicrobiales bacterium]
MRRFHGSRASTLAVVALLALSACSSGDARSVGPVPTAPPTTVEETTTTTAPPATSTTVARSVTTTRPPTTSAPATTVKPVVVDGIPQVTANPSRAAVGARVRIEGSGFTDEMWRARGATLWLAEKSGCNLYADATHNVTVSAAGRLTGELTVPSTGGCRMSSIGERPVTSGSYRIVFSCTACVIGELEVTTTAGPCTDVAFSPNSENLASDIVANGVGCVEAEALVRKVGAQVRSVGGPSRVEADGYVCVRTSENDPDRGLPSSDFECVSGAKKVTFTRW